MDSAAAAAAIWYLLYAHGGSGQLKVNLVRNETMVWKFQTNNLKGI